MTLCGSIREGVSKKRNRGSGGKGGSQTIFYSITVWIKILFSWKKKPIKVKQDKREKRNEEQTTYLQEQTRKRKPTEERKNKTKHDNLGKEKNSKDKPVIMRDNHGEKNQMHQEKREVMGSGQRKNERDNTCPHSDPQKTQTPTVDKPVSQAMWEFISRMIPKPRNISHSLTKKFNQIKNNTHNTRKSSQNYF